MARERRPSKPSNVVSVLALLLVICTGCRTVECASRNNVRHFSELWDLPGPNSDDHALAKRLPVEVEAAVYSYLVHVSQRKYCIPREPGDLPILAARVHGPYLLLDVGGCSLDGNFHLVYSTEKKCVVGFFPWYLQG